MKPAAIKNSSLSQTVTGDELKWKPGSPTSMIPSSASLTGDELKDLPKFIDPRHPDHRFRLRFLIVLFSGRGDALLSNITENSQSVGPFTAFQATYLSILPSQMLGEFIARALAYLHHQILSPSPDSLAKTARDLFLSGWRDSKQQPLHEFLNTQSATLLAFMRCYYARQEKWMAVVVLSLSFLSAASANPRGLRCFIKGLPSKERLHFLSINHALESVGAQKDFFNEKNLTERYAEIMRQAPMPSAVMTALWKQLCFRLKDYPAFQNLCADSAVFKLYSNLMRDMDSSTLLPDSKIQRLWQALNAIQEQYQPICFPQTAAAPGKKILLNAHSALFTPQLWTLAVPALTYPVLVSHLTVIGTQKQMADHMNQALMRSLKHFLLFDGVPLVMPFWKHRLTILHLSHLWTTHLQRENGRKTQREKKTTAPPIRSDQTRFEPLKLFDYNLKQKSWVTAALQAVGLFAGEIHLVCDYAELTDCEILRDNHPLKLTA